MSDTARAERWRARGGHFTWGPDEPGAEPVQIFHVEAGDRSLPVLLLVHGFPTCSIDWFDVVDGLSARFRVCALDFPGYGFSDKPRGWGYSLARDAELLGFYLTEVLAATSATVVAHDRGDSVALIHAARCADGACPVGLERLVLCNANIFLPLSQLTSLQQLLLDGATAPRVLAQLTPELLAQGMGMATFSPPRAADHPDVEALAATFAHGDGIAVLPETIQYLRERSADELTWLERLASTETPVSLVWGIEDQVSPPRVAMYVWNRFLMLKPGRNAFYLVPGANHYLQNDRPDALVATVLHAIDTGAEAPPGAIAPVPGAPVLVDHSRERLASAADLLAVPPGLADQIPG